MVDAEAASSPFTVPSPSSGIKLIFVRRRRNVKLLSNAHAFFYIENSVRVCVCNRAFYFRGVEVCSPCKRGSICFTFSAERERERKRQRKRERDLAISP